MRKIVKILGIILVSAFILLPLKTNATEAEWSQPLELDDSVSSSVVRVEDGVIVMQYEGTASSNNFLIKYDFSGNKIWEINNDYGWNIESVSDGFIVWNLNSVSKFDKDKNIQWTHSFDQPLGGNILEISDGYIIYDSEDIARNIFKMDTSGNFVKSIQGFNLFGNLASKTNVVANKMVDKEGFFFLIFERNEEAYMPTIVSFNNNLEEIQRFSFNTTIINNYVSFNKVIPTNDGNYIATSIGNSLFLKSTGETKVYNMDIFDIEQVGDYFYAYAVNQHKHEDNSLDYRSSIIKYDQNFQKIDSIELPLSFNSTSYGSGMFSLKHRTVYYNEGDNIYSIVLNSPLQSSFTQFGSDIRLFRYGSDYKVQNSSKYNIAKYRLNDSAEENKESNNNSSGIINSIIKNPETNSIIITIVFIVLVLAILITSYFAYQKKIKNKEIRK